jgi:hypothetical protein
VAVDGVSAVLAVLCLGIALFHLTRLVIPGATAGDEAVGGPVGEASHAVMAVGMAAMFSSQVSLLPRPVWTVAFVLCGAWFAATALRNRSTAMDAGHHVVGHVAMLFMLYVGHGATVADTAQGGGHDGHAGHGGGLGAGGLGMLGMVVSIVFAGYFVHHALRCLDRMRTSGTPSGTPAGPVGPVALRSRLRARVLTDPRSVATVHLLMAVAMAVMLLIMI